MKMAEVDVVDVPLATVDEDIEDISASQLEDATSNDISDQLSSCSMNSSHNADNKKHVRTGHFDIDSFRDSFSDSLEDLVSHFDKKISDCLKNFNENTNNIAPIQMRSQDEVMNESQIWWTLTGNFGNILPIDWSRSYTHNVQLSALKLLPKSEDKKQNANENSDDELGDSLDYHDMVVSSVSPYGSSPQTAEQVIEEIDEIMQQSGISELTGTSDVTMDSVDSMYSPLKPPASMLNSVVADEVDIYSRINEVASIGNNKETISSDLELQELPYKRLLALQLELETMIQIYNESLVQELALRDELEYEKELKNTFISLLLGIQQKRRQWFNECKRKNSKNGVSVTLPEGYQPQYLTACIPYRENQPVPDNATFQALIKILKAVNDDSPNVPNLLTNYILNVFCPYGKAAT
ncbi:Fasciculation and elongation protein zeta-2 [Trichinella pseudospiralis]|uniref:Fasciculation and elongation protein zeta-2 n=1 Tax=Trichinella pseudospiralis TaxID=6337 RepID=A0A0V0XNY3_TRIPS|nr:Fasciculation and elongation protein zeta-2 [Trichinella pseudospiralis]